jgi:hypothetical protein
VFSNRNPRRIAPDESVTDGVIASLEERPDRRLSRPISSTRPSYRPCCMGFILHFGPHTPPPRE